MTPTSSTPTLVQACLERRQRLMEELSEGLVLVRGAAAAGLNENFRYLTGVPEPRGTLLLAPEGVRIGTGRRYPGRDYVKGRMARSVLFLPSRDPLLARWGEDAAAVADDATPESYAVDAVLPSSDFAEVVSRALLEVDVLHVVRSSVPTLSGGPDLDALFVEDLRRRFFGLTVTDATALVHDLRLLGEHETEGPALGHHRQRLERRVQHQRPAHARGGYRPAGTGERPEGFRSAGA